MQYHLTHSCLVLVLSWVNYFTYLFGLGGIDINNQHVKLTKCSLCVCVCVFVCVCVCVCVCVMCETSCLSVDMHHKMKCCCKRNCSKIILNITAYISPIRLRNTAGDLAGIVVIVSGWGKTSDSK